MKSVLFNEKVSKYCECVLLHLYEYCSTNYTSCSQMMEYGKKAMEQASKNLKKRKLSSQSESAAKKRKSDAKHDEPSEKKTSAKKQLMLKLKISPPQKSGSPIKDGAVKKTSPKKLNESGSSEDNKMDAHSPVLVNLQSKLDSSNNSDDESSSEDEISLATLKKSVDLAGDQSSSSGSDDDIALADLKEQIVDSEPLKKKKKSDGKKHSKDATKNGKKCGKDSGSQKKVTVFYTSVMSVGFTSCHIMS